MTSQFQRWYAEKQTAWLYRTLAASERSPGMSTRFSSMADAAESHAQRLEEQIEREGRNVPEEFRPPLRTRVAAWLIRVFGPHWSRPLLSALRMQGLVDGARTQSNIGHPMPTSAAEVGQGHASVTAGSNLRAAVFGVNDGLVSNTSLIMGVAGATGEPNTILISGIAGLLAGAFSMAAGEYVSVSSQRELYEKQIHRERIEIARYPKEETEEIALIYNARGIPMPEARRIAGILMRDPEHALETHAREELGLNPEDLGSPIGAASSSFLSFFVGGVIPLLPFLLYAGHYAVPLAALLAGIALFGIGMVINIFTGVPLLRGGLRMLLIGGGAGFITYLIGTLLGVSLA